MVSLTDVQASNARVASALPAGLVAVFVGATGGIGEFTLKRFAAHALRPRVYFTGRSQDAGARVAAECKALNAEGEFVYIQADTSLLRTVDDVCRQIKGRETAVNLLFLTAGTLVAGQKTDEGLHFAAALVTYSRTRFVANLLPLLQRATALRRVVSVLAAGKEGAVNAHDLQGWNVPILQQRGQGSTLVTLSLEALAARAPTVTFVHNFPGAINTSIAKGIPGAAGVVVRALGAVVGPFFYMPHRECGERHVFLATSGRYAPGADRETAAGVPLADGVAVARGTDGTIGSGVYSVDQHGESSGPKVEELLARFRAEGLRDTVWENTNEEFRRITGVEAI